MVSMGKGGSSSQEAGSEQKVWDVQVPFLEQLYGAGSNLFGAQEGGPGVSEMYNWTLPQMQNAFQDMISGGGGPGQDWLQQSLGQNPYLQSAIESAQGDVYRNLERNVLPGEATSAAGAGQFGMDRHGLAQALRTSEADRMASDIGVGMRQQDLSRQQQAATGLAQFGQQAKQFGMGAIPQMMQTAMMPQQSQWAPFMNYAQILGGPHNIGSSFSRGSSGGGWNVGFGNMG